MMVGYKDFKLLFFLDKETREAFRLGRWLRWSFANTRAWV